MRSTGGAVAGGCPPTASPAPEQPPARPEGASARIRPRLGYCERSTGSASAAIGPWATRAVGPHDGRHPARAGPDRRRNGPVAGGLAGGLGRLGLLLLLDAHRLAGRLPLEIQVQVGWLRHAVKLAIQAHAASRSGSASPAPAEVDASAALRAWIAAQPWAQPGPQGWVYLLCFRDPATGEHRPLQGQGCRGQYAGHYWGWTQDLIRRINQHHNPTWTGAGRLVQVALAAGLSFELAWCEYPATRGRERRLKNQGSAYRRCPLCRGTGGPLDPAQAVAAVQHQLGGRP
jgi:hypothetical protein